MRFGVIEALGVRHARREAARRRADRRDRFGARTAGDVTPLRRERADQPPRAGSGAEIKRLTGGRGVDVAIEALGRQETFKNALRAIRPGGTLSSLGVYSGKLVAPYESIYAGLGNRGIVTTLCPGGKERMRRLMEMVAHERVDLTPLGTHRFALDDIEEAFDLFSHQRGGVLEVALHPAPAPVTSSGVPRRLAGPA
jgi:threonine dehydrogenase-like Zn-dependent dehydrogenase